MSVDKACWEQPATLLPIRQIRQHEAVQNKSLLSAAQTLYLDSINKAHTVHIQSPVQLINSAAAQPCSQQLLPRQSCCRSAFDSPLAAAAGAAASEVLLWRQHAAQHIIHPTLQHDSAAAVVLLAGLQRTGGWIPATCHVKTMPIVMLLAVTVQDVQYILP